MDKCMNFALSLDKIMGQIRALGMSYNELLDALDVNSNSYLQLEDVYREHCKAMTDEERCDERHRVNGEMHQCLQWVGPLYENSVVNEWLFHHQDDEEMPEDVLKMFEDLKVECLALDICVTKMAVVCKLCPDEMYRARYPEDNDFYL